MISHKKAIPRATVVGAITTIVTYVFGVIFSDMIGLPYLIVGIMSIPVTFTIAYILNRNWVFKEDKEIEILNYDELLKKGIYRVVTCHKR